MYVVQGYSGSPILVPVESHSIPSLHPVSRRFVQVCGLLVKFSPSTRTEVHASIWSGWTPKLTITKFDVKN